MTALEIAETEQGVDRDVLICACLLHDIGRQEQFENPELCHAQVGADKAYRFLTDHAFSQTYAARVRGCIETHRFRKSNPPQSIEAKILFDADKIDVSGAMGIARTLIYKGQVSHSLYTLLPDGTVSDGTGDEQASFFQEYQYKLKNLYDHFYTARGAEIAERRRAAAVSFYNSLLREARESRENGPGRLGRYVKSDG